jgi:rRNA maturation endonuclease Nob1
MADPLDEKIEKKVEETVAPKQDGELSEADIEAVAGGVLPNPLPKKPQ